MEHLTIPLPESWRRCAISFYRPSDLGTDNVSTTTHPSGKRLDLGKVLAGIQAPEEDSTRFSEFLRDLGYPYVEETQNVIYKRYLRK
jgi:C-terminal regulatory domain of Threonine dehydratase